MAGARVDMPINGAADWSSFVDIVQLMMESYFSVSLTNMETNSEPLIESIGFVVVKGTVYKFAGNETITGWAGLSISTEAYIYIVPSAGTCTAIWSITAPTWDSDYQGWYNGNNRCIGGAYKDGSSNCTKKWLGFNSTRGAKGSQTNRQRIIRVDVEPDAIGDQELDLGVAANQVDGDVTPLGTAVTSSPTGGTTSNLANSSFIRAAIQEAFNRLIDLTGVGDNALLRRHINVDVVGSAEIDWGPNADDVNLDDMPDGPSTYGRILLTALSSGNPKTDSLIDGTYQKVHGDYVDASARISHVKENEGSVRVYPVIIEIGDWDLSSTVDINIQTKITGAGYDKKKVRSLEVIIRNDGDTIYIPVPRGVGQLAQILEGFKIEDGTNKLYVKIFMAKSTTAAWVLTRVVTASPDYSDWNSTSYNRGWITIWLTV